MTDPIDLEALRAALAAGPTDGPWHFSEDGFGQKAPVVYATDTDLRYLAVCNDRLFVGKPTDNLVNAKYIAACDPTTIGALVAELTTRRARDAEVEALVTADMELDAAADELAAAKREKGNWRVNPLGDTHPAVIRMRAAKARRIAALAPFTGATP